ncbi:MAG TPA: hypothetical protein DCZ94_12290 [Lentisphaeria bacterium]|nr:MAG: hypothetical protein A2X48_21850 [Lentisphaerae bacterium GWF2_49_21]HBC87729.1 hypothetical protein [Lentisphaeria bacterium]
MKYDLIIAELKKDIIRGRYEPLSRLPTRNELARRFSTTLATMQNAMDILAKEGFIDSRGRDGTFVVDNPPHLSKYGMCIPELPSNMYLWHRLWTVINGEALKIRRDPSKRIENYYGITANSEIGDFKKLIEDIEEHRLAGLIIFWPSVELLGKLKKYDIPIVSFSRPIISFPRMSVIWVDYISMIDKMISYLKKRERRRIAIITNSETPREYMEHFKKKVQENGMTTHPSWIHGVCLCKDALPWCSSVFELLMSGSREARPDALVILNENITPFISSAISKSSLMIPDDIEIVSHCNFPFNSTNDHIHRIGFDINLILNRCICEIDSLHKKNSKPCSEELPAIDQDEISART